MSHNKSARALSWAVAGLVATTAVADPVQFSITYLDGANEGFNDPVVGTARKNAFSFALDQWSDVLIASYAGETINVTAEFSSLGGSATSATLAQAGPELFYNLNLAPGGLWVPVALTNHILAQQFDNTPHIGAVFNADVDNGAVLGATDFYYGTDKNAGIDIDFVSTAMHEIGHGLGFTTSLNASTGQFDLDGNSTPDDPTIWDFFLVDENGDQLVSMTPSERLDAITDDSLFWGGTEGTVANGGFFPKIFDPTTFIGGSSLTHLDETVHKLDLLSPNYDEPNHEVSAIARGMLTDMLWDTTPIPEPASAAVVFMSGAMLTFAGRRRYRRQAAA